MALPIRSFAAPLFGALLAVAGVPGAAWANDPPHPDNHHSGNAGAQHPAPANQPRPQAPSGPAPTYGGHGGGGAPGGQAANHPAQIDRPGGGGSNGGGPAWHGAGGPGNAPVNNGARGQANGYYGNARPNNGQQNYGQPNRGQPNNGQANNAQPNYNQRDGGQQNYGQRGYAGGGQQYRDQRNDGRNYGRNDGQRWNNGWRNDRRYDWAGWRSAHGELFHGQYYHPPYGGYGYARLGIGAAIDEAFLDEQYWIDDPEYYHLPPADGPYRWVRYYNDCLLIDIDSGQIVDVLYNVFW